MRIIKQIVVIILGMLSFGANAQDELDIYVSNNSEGEGVLVKWVSTAIVYPEGINIYRKANNKEWELITSRPIVPPTSLENKSQYNEAQIASIDAFLSQPLDSFREDFSGIFTILETYRSQKFALAFRNAYLDKSVKKGTTYQYKIEAIIKGKKKELGLSEKIIHQDFEPQLEPVEFEIKRKKKNTELLWKVEEPRFYAYNVYKQKDGEEWKLIGKELFAAALAENTKSYFLQTATSKDTAYSYKIEGLDNFGIPSVMSEVVVSPIVDFDPPIMPEMTIFTYSKEMRNRIYWKPPVDLDASHYNLYRSTLLEDESFIRINKKEIPVTDTTYIDQLYDGGIYYYKLELLDKAGNSTITFPVASEVFDILPPQAPANFKAVADTGLLKLSWDANKEGDLLGYQIFRTVASTSGKKPVYVPVATDYITTTYYEEPMAEHVRNEFIYIVRAADTLLNLSEPSNSASVQLPDVTAPEAPFILKTFEKDSMLAIQWMPNVDKDLQGYNLYRKTKGEAEFNKVNISPIPATVDLYIDKSVDRGVTYVYAVNAVDESDLISENSNEVYGKLDPLPLAGELEIIRQKVNENKGEIVLEWTPQLLVNEPVVGMAVYRSKDGGLAMPVSEVSMDTRFKQKIQPGEYTYHIRAFGKRGGLIKSQIISVKL